MSRPSQAHDSSTLPKSVGEAALILGGTLRLTRAVTTDAIGEALIHRPVTRGLRRWYGVDEHGRLRVPTDARWSLAEAADGLGCPFCVGFWLGVGVLAGHALTARSPRGRAAWRFVMASLTLNEVVGHVSAWIDQP